MTVYARSDVMSVAVGEAHGGCGQRHERGDLTGPWALTCPGGCEEFLRADQHWSATPAEVPETFDEQKHREAFEKRGIKDRDALLAIAMARMAGISQAEIPPSLSKMLTGLPAHVPGVTVCPAGHDNTPGNRFCGQCGAAMTAPAAAGPLTAGAAA